MVSGIILRNVGTLIPECWYRSNRISGILMPEQRYKTARNTQLVLTSLSTLVVFLRNVQTSRLEIIVIFIYQVLLKENKILFVCARQRS